MLVVALCDSPTCAPALSGCRSKSCFPAHRSLPPSRPAPQAPKFDITKLMEVHGDYSEEVGTKVERPAAAPAAEEAPAA